MPYVSDRFLHEKMLTLDGNRADRLFWNLFHIHSSLVASRSEHDDMLEFAARHSIKPTIEVFKHEGASTISEIIERLRTGNVRYRAVLAF